MPGDKVYVLGPALRCASRGLAVCLVALIMLLPTLAFPQLTGVAERAIASVIAATTVLMIVGFFTQARTIELVACGARYDCLEAAFSGRLI